MRLTHVRGDRQRLRKRFVPGKQDGVRGNGRLGKTRGDIVAEQRDVGGRPGLTDNAGELADEVHMPELVRVERFQRAIID